MNAARLSVATIVLLVVAFQAQSVAEPTDTTNSTKLKASIAKELVSAADAASDNGQCATAATFLNEALELVPEDRKATKALEKLDAHENSTDAEAVGKYEKKVEKYLKKAATGYCMLFSELFADKDTAGVNGYLNRAYQLHQETADDWVETEYKARFGKKDYADTQRILDIAQAYPTEDEKHTAARLATMIECEAQVSSKSPIMKSCRGHEMKYYLSLPTGWSADKKWPVYVAVEGAGSNFLGACKGGKGKSNDTFIVVTPIGFTNTNELNEGMRKKYPYDDDLIDEADKNRMSFDEAGLLAIIEDLKSLYSAQDKVCITGFSGGGILTWHMVFTHPDKLLAAVPACGNFAGVRGEISDDAEAKKTLIIHAYQGDKDQYKESMLDAQWENAEKLAKANGYENVTRDIVPGGHISCHTQARNVFREALGLEVE